MDVMGVGSCIVGGYEVGAKMLRIDGEGLGGPERERTRLWAAKVLDGRTQARKGSRKGFCE